MNDQYRQAFQDEARELVSELESALLALDQDRANLDLVGRAFRALHTIKGSGAMFGFDQLAAFTHHIENAFDLLRNGKMAVSTDLIRLALAAGDQIKGLLEETADGARGAEILAAVDQITAGQIGGLMASKSQAKPAAPSTSSAPEAGSGADPGGLVRRWRIRFRPSPEILAHGTNPLLLFAELRQMGALETAADTSEIPPLEDLDPERCYLGWHLVLDTRAAREAIRDVFIFVEDASDLEIEPVAEEAAAAAAPPVAQGAAAPASQSAAQPASQSASQSSSQTKTRLAAAAQNRSLRVSTERLDQLINVVGELVTVQARLSEAAARYPDAAEIQEIAQAVERLTGELRENSMSIRMLPLRSTFERFRRLVHDLANELGKDVELAIEGADTELDKTVIDQLNDPLVHLIRNSMDHGIETPQLRQAAGKRAKARIQISAQHAGAHVLVRVGDDGRGLDAERVRARAVEQGLIEPGARLSEPEVFALVLQPGFSTARQVTDLSGRGVGMDVVRRSVEALQGSIEISNQTGAGMTVTLRLPLTLAIIDGLLVRVGEERFVLPLANSLECVELTAADIESQHGKHIANVRGEMIPYIRLREYFRIASEARAREQIMVVETEYGRYGFVVDEVLGDHQTVIKKLGKTYRNVQDISGATILGNGSVALILDPHRLVQNAIQAVSQLGSRTAAGMRRPSERIPHEHEMVP